jgi:hypothetical protein
MSPHCRLLRGTGVPRWCRQTTAPVDSLSAYTVSFSVAAMTVSPTTSGWPYTAPSRRAVHRWLSGPAAGRSAAMPVRAAFWPNSGQAAAGCPPALGPVPSVTCAGGGALCWLVAAVPLEHAATLHAIAARRILPARIQPVSQGGPSVAADFSLSVTGS